eukprot:6368626-Amphidinium_carterae.2
MLYTQCPVLVNARWHQLQSELAEKEVELEEKEGHLKLRERELQQKIQELEGDRWALEHRFHQQDVAFRARASWHRDLETRALEIEMRQRELVQKEAGWIGLANCEIGKAWRDWTRKDARYPPRTVGVRGSNNNAPKDAFDV